jgi:hypothetical protein
METTINPSVIREQVSITGLLSRLGFEPARNSGRELLYRSMLRDGDTKPSFCVNDSLGVWFDHGTGKGGNVIDFGLAFWPALGFKDVCGKLCEVMQQTAPAAISFFQPGERKRRKALKLPHYRVDKIHSLGHSPAIQQYLERRGIWEIAQGILQEVHYHVTDEKRQVKHFFAAGHRNESGGWEVRNKYFKGCLGHKGLTLIEGDNRRLCLFEGFFDYLSWKHEHQEQQDSALVLNTLSLLPAAIKVATRYPHLTVFFDNDTAGRQASRQFITELPYASDGASAFAGHHDYNDKRRVEARAAREALQPKDLFKNIAVPFER